MVCGRDVRGTEQEAHHEGRGGGAHQRKIVRQRLKAAVADQSDATPVGLRKHLGVNCSRSAICKVLKQLKLTYKKRFTAADWRQGTLRHVVH